MAALVDRPHTEQDLQQAVTNMRRVIAEGDYPYSVDQDNVALAEELATIRKNLIWAPGRVVWDDPSSIATEGQAGVMVEALYRKLESLQQELTIESAYFVVTDRGVRVRILTNSLPSIGQVK